MAATSVRELNDRELVVAFQRGEAGAYDEMFRRYRGRVMSICTRMLGQSHDAEEAVQETFLKAYQALPRFNGNYQVAAWLARIAANVCVDQIRSRSRSGRSVTLDAEDMLDGSAGPEDAVAGGDLRVDIAISKIQPLHAKALQLRALHGLSHQEMAGQLHMTPAQVKALLHRARNSFKRAWQKAEGWALAPVFAFRSMIEGRRDGSEAGSLATAAPSFSPLMVERVAASAVMVVAALSGLPTHGSDASAPPAVVDVAQAPDTRQDRAARGRAAKAGSSWTATPARHRAAAPVSKTPAVTAPDEVTEIVGETRGRLGEDPGDDADPGKIPSTNASGASKTLLKQVRHATRTVLSLIPPTDL